jgi:hypothetical protein
MTAISVAAEAPGFKLTKKYPLPGDGGHDYVVFDGSANRVYVSHGTEVDVVDADSGILVGKVENTPGVHGIAIVPGLHRGFTTNGGNATISVFDTLTLETVRTIKVSADPDFILYDSRLNRVLVCHGDGAAITAIDPEKAEVIGKIDLGGGAEAAVVDGRGMGFVNLEEAATVVSFGAQPSNKNITTYFRRPFVVPIPGTSHARRLEENVAAAGLRLSADTEDALDHVFAPGAAAGTRYPAAHLERLLI